MSWYFLSLEIRCIILQNLAKNGGDLASFAAVSREWQGIIEPFTFAQIRLTKSRLAEFDAMTLRNRALVRYVWLCLELQRYDCTTCAHGDEDDDGIYTTSTEENTLIKSTLQDLFSALSAWEPNGGLTLDINVYSPSDSEHWFKHLTFEPDTLWGTSNYDQRVDDMEQFRAADDPHDWKAYDWDANPLGLVLPEWAILRVFGEIMAFDSFEDDEQVDEWWLRLPLIPAVTSVMIRQQNRRRWNPQALALMLARLPRLRELHYEPWREWLDEEQYSTDESYLCLLEYLASTGLRKVSIFENFHQQYAKSFLGDCELIRSPKSSLSRMLYKVSLNLESLSGSFMVDASHFFNHCGPSQKWPNLATLVLTSQLLAPEESQTAIMDMLRQAGIAALRMPKLKTMEIWNGQENLAALFKYEILGEGRPSTITWRGTWNLIMQTKVIKTWEAVTNRHRGSGLILACELLDGDDILSHAHAICRLKLSEVVIRPISLQQIQMDHRFEWMNGSTLDVLSELMNDHD